MAIREKTVCFAFPMTTVLVQDAVTTNLTQITLYIPEASPVFTSVFVEVGFQDLITATGGRIAEHRCGLRLGAAAYTTITELDDINHSSENMAGVIGPFDFTSHFTTNWTGTSMTCDVQVYFDQNTGTTLGMANVTALVYVTYQYDDTAATQIKTVWVPLESLAGSLPTAAANFGTNQIPQLTGAGGMLPEGSPVIRDWFLVIEGNENNNNVANSDFTMSVNIDGGTTTSFTTQEAALGSDRFCRWFYKPTIPATGSSHNLQLWSSLANKCNHVTVTLYVTYEFALTGTTRVLNSILVPIEIASPLGSGGESAASRFTREIMIQEPGSITLKQSGFRINYNVQATPVQHSWRAGGQAFRTYTALMLVSCGMFSVQQRIDSGSEQGAGITIDRGRNSIAIDGYVFTTVNQMTNVNGYVILNYESDLGANGIGQHCHTVFKTLLPWDAALSDRNRIDDYSFSIPESNYWIVATGFSFIQWVQTNSACITFDVECLSTEGKGGGYYEIYADAYQADSERACSVVWLRGRDTFKRFPADAGPDRVDIGVARDYRLFNTTACSNGIFAALTYHSFTWTAAGNISGHNAALPTVVRLVDDQTGEVMQQQTLAAGTTAFSFTVYDNTEDYYISAYQDDTHVGRSGIEKAA